MLDQIVSGVTVAIIGSFGWMVYHHPLVSKKIIEIAAAISIILYAVYSIYVQGMFQGFINALESIGHKPTFHIFQDKEGGLLHKMIDSISNESKELGEQRKVVAIWFMLLSALLIGLNVASNIFNSIKNNSIKKAN